MYNLNCRNSLTAEHGNIAMLAEWAGGTFWQKAMKGHRPLIGIVPMCRTVGPKHRGGYINGGGMLREWRMKHARSKASLIETWRTKVILKPHSTLVRPQRPQWDLDKLQIWSEKWQVECYPGKWEVEC